jgi:two-component system alkaline phosphatase synthesis response regulator PhoP
MNQINQRSKIMIVEDDDHIAQLLIFLFQREGLITEHAADGQVAAKMIEQSAPPSLILLDMMLPYQDGFSLLNKIRTQPEWEELPVIMLTSKSHESGIVRALNAGANDYVVKPFQPGELIARVKQLLLISQKQRQRRMVGK